MALVDEVEELKAQSAKTEAFEVKAQIVAKIAKEKMVML